MASRKPSTKVSSRGASAPRQASGRATRSRTQSNARPDARSGSRPGSRAVNRQGSRSSVRSSGKKTNTSFRQQETISSLIEGRRAAAEALELGVPIKQAFVVQSESPDAALTELLKQLESLNIPIRFMPRARLDEMSSHGAHQGIVVETRSFAYSSVEQIIEQAGTGDALIVLLDHVTDEGNLGAIIRSVEVVGGAGVILPKARSARVGVGAYKTSAGAVLHTPIAQVSNLVAAMDQLKAAGFWIGAATEHATESVWNAPMDGRLCIVMGSEGSGISRLVREHCDFECALPQRGRIESLNVAQAATVMCYEWLRRIWSSSSDVAENN